MYKVVPMNADPVNVNRAEVDAAFRDFVGDDGFSCLAGKGVVNSGGYQLRLYDAMGCPRSTRAFARDLADFATSLPADGLGLHAFVAVFPFSQVQDERHFETQLWRQLGKLHECDSASTGWDPSVSDDPDDPHFSFSVGGAAMFVVGLHPGSSRFTRRFAWPTLVFNPRAQFERLRAEGRFERLRAAVREREVMLQGSINPNLADFGEKSEARQYSGRATEPEWRCPFHRDAR